MIVIMKTKEGKAEEDEDKRGGSRREINTEEDQWGGKLIAKRAANDGKRERGEKT